MHAKRLPGDVMLGKKPPVCDCSTLHPLIPLRHSLPPGLTFLSWLVNFFDWNTKKLKQQAALGRGSRAVLPTLPIDKLVLHQAYHAFLIGHAL
jgi:hypothetical protein